MSVHATVERLGADRLIELVPNSDYQRSQLVSMTTAGREAYGALDRRQAAWVNRLAAGIDQRDLADAARVLALLCRRLDHGRGDGER